MTVNEKTIDDAVNSFKFPKALTDTLIHELKEKGVTKKQLDEVLRRVNNSYEKAKIEPFEAAGVVSAQSIGEPGTQMSIDGCEKVIVKINNEIRIYTISEFVDDIINKQETRLINNSEVCCIENSDISVPSLNENGKIEWKQLLEVSRHKPNKKLIRIKTNSGREITATDNHSFVMRVNGKIIPVLGSELKVGERIPVIKNLPSIPSDFVYLNEYCYDLDSIYSEYHKDGDTLVEHSKLYIPESIALDETFGWSVGACLAKGNVPDFAFNSNEEFISGLLRAYFSKHGNVSLEKKVIKTSSNSKELIDSICILLSRLGIFSTKQKNKNEHSLSISYNFAELFKEKICFDSEKKITALLELCKLSHQNSEKSCDTEDVVWDKITDISYVESSNEHVYDFSVKGLETFTTFEGIITHNTMRTFHYAGVAEINVTLGLPRLIEIVDARKNPSTPMMTVYLEQEYATDRDKARSLAWKIEATNITVLGDMSTDLTNMKIIVELNKKAVSQRDMSADDIASVIRNELGILVEVTEGKNGQRLVMVPEEPTYRQLLQLVKNLNSITLKGIEGIKRVVLRKEDSGEYVLYTEGSKLKEVLAINGVDVTRTSTNNINEIYEVMGIEAARSSLIHEATETLGEQGLDVDVRHIMLVADIMTVDGDVKPIGRHGISGEKASVLARAAFEVTVNHLLDSGLSGDVDELSGVTENVIVGQPIRLGTGNVKLIAKKS